MKKITHIACLGLCALYLSACGSPKEFLDSSFLGSSFNSSEQNQASESTPDALYKKAREQFSNAQWQTSAKSFQKLEQQYPYSIYAQQALMHIAYSHWKEEDRQQALRDLNRFLSTYPYSPYIDYVLYLKGIIHITPEQSFLNSLISQKTQDTDPQGLKDAYKTFKVLTTEFPNSKYSRDAKLRMKWIVSTLAEHEIQVAIYYLKRGAYLGAINRAQYVLTEFSQVKAAEKALYIMWKAYGKLGLEDKAMNAKRVLDLNYPNSTLYKTGLKHTKQLYQYLDPNHWFNYNEDLLAPSAQ